MNECHQMGWGGASQIFYMDYQNCSSLPSDVSDVFLQMWWVLQGDDSRQLPWIGVKAMGPLFPLPFLKPA